LVDVWGFVVVAAVAAEVFVAEVIDEEDDDIFGRGRECGNGEGREEGGDDGEVYLSF
jgi:hypothetical protein